MDLEEVVLELHSQLQQSKQAFQDLKEKFLICTSTMYSLAKQLQKYRKDNDLIASVLGEKMQFHDEELAERLTVEEQLSTSWEKCFITYQRASVGTPHSAQF
uniref:Neuroblastoma breakpoint family member 5 n=1 Tax=Sciurus vulgaris TaxID=55149 RepID=A0A8D2AII8_SCIVU